MTEKLIADAQRLAEDVSQRADYGGVFQAIQAGIDHILDSRDEWRKLTRAELIDNLMAVHHAGLTPQISVAVVGLAAAVGRDVLRERDRLAAHVAELEATLEAKRGQHVDTLHYLEQAQRVIDRDSAAYGRLLRVLWQSRRAAQERAEQAREGGKFLAKAVSELNQIALDATDLHDAINENGDGDWQAVWENVSDLGVDLRAARKRIAEVEAERDAAISIARSNSHALDKTQAELTRLRTDREQELTAIAAKQQRDARRIAELEAQVQR